MANKLQRLYPLSALPFSEEVFSNPASVYRDAPFWSWNCKITREMIDEQIDFYHEMGVGGFHVHVRVGLVNEYLGDEFMSLIRHCAERAKEKGMVCWLYDEDRYASGIAGGIVTKEYAYRARYLRLSVAHDESAISRDEFLSRQAAGKRVTKCIIHAYDVVMEDGYLVSADIIAPDAPARGVKWYLYEEIPAESGWCNGQTYVDVMNPDAIRRFVEVTHERYKETVGDLFGPTVPSIFTDEPHCIGNSSFARADGRDDVTLAFTDKFPEFYAERSCLDFWQVLPEILWNKQGDDRHAARHAFYDAIGELFARAYMDTIGNWCEENGIAYTGHVLSEENLAGQSDMVGDAMLSYRSFHIPGLDNLCDIREFSSAKQVTSVAHQYGREGSMSEEYGVTQWHFGFDGYKKAGDWQAALGITLRVPHLSWASMAGEAKRDYPAAIGWQSPWFRDYSLIADHFARVGYCLTRGNPLIRVGLLHPVESMWILKGPTDQMGGAQQQLENDFQAATEWLLTGGIDFDYMSEALLASMPAQPDEARFHFGKMAYDAVVVPSVLRLRKSTIDRLNTFLNAGGTVIWMSATPAFADGVSDEAFAAFLGKCTVLSPSKDALLNALSPVREVELLSKNGSLRDKYVHQLRQDGDARFLFIAQAFTGEKARREGMWFIRPENAPDAVEIRIKGNWNVEVCDTVKGILAPVESRRDGWTSFSYCIYNEDSLLLRLTPGDENLIPTPAAKPVEKGTKTVAEPAAFALSEPNVYLIDKCEYRLADGESFSPEMEILRLGAKLRTDLGYNASGEHDKQPYARYKEDVRDHVVTLRHSFESAVDVENCLLALEERAFVTGTLNGTPIDMTPMSYYVDRAIETVKLPPVKKGTNELVLRVEYGEACNLEWMYLLGEFGVELAGAHKCIVEMPERLYWGDFTRQGLPFYTGNVTYFVRCNSEEARTAAFSVPHYSGAAIKIGVQAGDEIRDEQMAAFAPHTAKLPLAAGENTVAVTFLGNRNNGFGPLHLMGTLSWCGPNAWRVSGDFWTDGYNIRPMGILSAPSID